MAGAAFETSTATQPFPQVVNESLNNGVGTSTPAMDPHEQS
jgi:hypothetical protein